MNKFLFGILVCFCFVACVSTRKCRIPSFEALDHPTIPLCLIREGTKLDSTLDSILQVEQGVDVFLWLNKPEINPDIEIFVTKSHCIPSCLIFDPLLVGYANYHGRDCYLYYSTELRLLDKVDRKRLLPLIDVLYPVSMDSIPYFQLRSDTCYSIYYFSF